MVRLLNSLLMHHHLSPKVLKGRVLHHLPLNLRFLNLSSKLKFYFLYIIALHTQLGTAMLVMGRHFSTILENLKFSY